MDDLFRPTAIRVGGSVRARGRVGEGGMAVVYKATDLKHERTVAIKVLRQELSVSLGADRFLREIRVAANLQHPNILGLYDSGEAEGLLYYVMPFVEGESLRDRLNKEQQLPLGDALQIAREAAEALQYAHEQASSTGTSSPRTSCSPSGHALVADFGIARAVSQAGGEKLTQTGMAVGTPHYMSPEQSLGERARRCPERHLQPRVRALRGAHRPAALHRPELDGDHGAALDGGGAQPAGRAGLGPGRGGRRGHAGAREDAGGPLPDDEGIRRAALGGGGRSGDGADGAAAGVDGGAAASTDDLCGAKRKTGEVELVERAGRGAKFWSMVGVASSCSPGRLRRLQDDAPAGGADAASDDSGGLDANHIAVLYFEPRGRIRTRSGISRTALTEALIHEIAQVPQLQVISRTACCPTRNPRRPGQHRSCTQGGNPGAGYGDPGRGPCSRVDVSLTTRVGQGARQQELERPRGERNVRPAGHLAEGSRRLPPAAARR